MKTSLYTFLLLMLLALSIGACTDNEPQPTVVEVPTTAEPIKKSHGAPIGDAVRKTIGTEGGTLQMPDQSIRLNIPAGAVTNATEFSIQQVQNTFPGSTAPSFRLLPEGVTFSKPITLTYSYAGLNLDGTAAEALYLTYQDQEGVYHIATNTFLHKESKTLTVETTHFSDWTCFESYRIYNEYEYLRVSDMTELRVQYFMPMSLTDDRAGEWMEVYDPKSTYEWYLAWGEGNVTTIEEGKVGWYTAPAAVPEENPVGVAVKIRNVHFIINKDDPARGQYSSEELTLISRIFIQPMQFVDYTLDGVKYVIYGDCYETGCIRAVTKSGFSLRITMSDNRYMEIYIPGANGVGSYPWGPEDKEGYMEVGTGWENDNKRYTTSYSPCNLCDYAYSTGMVKITKWGNGYDDYLEGEYSATVYERGTNGKSSKVVGGKFSVKRS